jgi:hypothetical protein
MDRLDLRLDLETARPAEGARRSVVAFSRAPREILGRLEHRHHVLHFGSSI